MELDTLVIRLTDNFRSAISPFSFRRVPDIALFLFPLLLKQQKRELRKQTVEMKKTEYLRKNL